VPTIADLLAAHDVRSGEQLTVDDVLAADAWARAEAARLIHERPA
jgi:1-deoxy-D-xylulose-5-phosphate reductoisomerase